MISRRKFLIALSTLPVLPFAIHPILAAFPPLPERSPEARAKHYRETAQQVKHPWFRPGQQCSNCRQFRRLDHGCDLFSRNSVSPSGWCQGWRQKA